MLRIAVFIGLILSTGFHTGFPKESNNRFIIKIEKGTLQTVRNELTAKTRTKNIGFKIDPLFKALQIYAVEFSTESSSSSNLKSLLHSIRNITSIKEDLEIEFRTNPNDPEFGEQKDMEIIQAPDVWNFTQGGMSFNNDEIVLAVIDDGFQLNHEEFEGNLWVNSAEIPNNGIDDDQNGYIDDYNGAFVRDNNGDHPVKGHGTSVAGIAGAKGDNGKGVAGVNWNVKLMLVSIGSSISNIVKAYEYVHDQRLKYNQSNGQEGAFVVVVNGSFGLSEPFFGSEFPIWCGLYNALGEVGVLSVSSTTNKDRNVDVEGDMPSTCTSQYLITVNNTTINDVIAPTTGYGPIHIDLAAPGDGSFTIKLDNQYGLFEGTSASAPHVSGAIGLLYSIECKQFADLAISNPSTAASRVKEAIMNGVDPIPDIEGITVSGGRLNILNSALEFSDICMGSSGDLAIEKVFPSPADEQITIVYETPDYEIYEVLIHDTSGKLVYADSVNPPIFGQKMYTIPVSTFSSGIYFLSILNQESKVTYKFVKS